MKRLPIRAGPLSPLHDCLMNYSLRFLSLACLIAPGLAVRAGTLTVQVSDAAGQPLANAVVTAEVEGIPASLAPRTAVIEQRGQKFIPLVSVVQTGTTVSFPNNDKFKHHIYSFSPAKKFDQKLYSGVAAAPQVFDKAGVVVLGCNIHDRMVAYIKVVETPYFARTDAAGVARLELPATGRATVSVWHYNMSAPVPDQGVQLKSAAPLAFRLSLKPPILDEAD
ncbi:MAG: methylamine utilization protein [Gammaproteobacteria bacterium]